MRVFILRGKFLSLAESNVVRIVPQWPPGVTSVWVKYMNLAHTALKCHATDIVLITADKNQFC